MFADVLLSGLRLDDPHLFVRKRQHPANRPIPHRPRAVLRPQLRHPILRLLVRSQTEKHVLWSSHLVSASGCRLRANLPLFAGSFRRGPTLRRVEESRVQLFCLFDDFHFLFFCDWRRFSEML